MGLYVSTTGTDVPIPELGFSIVHPATNYPLSEQFSSEEIQRAGSLTDAIRGGTLLTWKKTSGGSVELATDYDPDLLEADALNLGLGAKADRVVTYKDLSTYPLYKSGRIAPEGFTGTPRVASVTFGTAMPDAAYDVTVTGTDGRSWAVTNIAVGGFTINTQANQPLTGPVYWHAIRTGESV